MKLFLVSLVLIFSVDLLQAQDTITDTLFTAGSDTSAVDTTKRYDVDTVIYTTASDSLIFYIKKKEMEIYGDGELQYRETDLKSANIKVDFETSNIEAIGVPSDSIPDAMEGTPVLKEGTDSYEGVRMKYNFKTKRGYISSAGTASEGAVYTGTKINKVDEETYFIQDGIYTTCEIDTPHYHFYSPQMKVIHKEQITARWIWIFFGGVPFPVPLPFAVFPIESGRRSGILPPVYGDDARFGRYFSRFGYFWAISDYMDWNLTADYFTRGSYRLNSRFRYAQRYNFTGNVEGNYDYYRTNEQSDPDYGETINWRIKLNHNQNIDPTLRFDANLEFMSGGDFLRRSVTQLSEVLRNEIRSNANIFKSWEESGNSLSLSYSRRQDLESGDINEVLPNLTFSMNQKYPFRSTEAGGGEQSWYESFGFGYSGQFQNNRNKIDGDLKIRGGIQHNISAGFSPKLGFFSFTPSFRYVEKWYNKRINRYSAGLNSAGTDSTITEDVKEINFVRTFSLGVGTNTKFYGMFQPGVLGISAIRHTVSPTISYSFQPDFSKPGWGYYDSYVDAAGNVVKYNKYEREIFGGAGAGEQQSISFSVLNVFEMKTTVDPTDTTSKEQKIQLLNLDGSINYNFAADSIKFSPLRVGFRTQIGDWLNFNGGSTFSLYESNEQGRDINKFLINEGKGLARLTNFNFSISSSISGEKLKSVTQSVPGDTLPEGEFELGQAENKIYKGLYDEREPDFSIPWDISLTYNYNYSKPTPISKIISSNISGGINFNLTKNWKFSFSGSYDFQNHEFAAPQVRISRDLHCWIMNFTWNPIGTYRGYRFEIRVKAPQLQDLKVTKRDDFFSGK